VHLSNLSKQASAIQSHTDQLHRQARCRVKKISHRLPKVYTFGRYLHPGMRYPMTARGLTKDLVLELQSVVAGLWHRYFVILFSFYHHSSCSHNSCFSSIEAGDTIQNYTDQLDRRPRCRVKKIRHRDFQESVLVRSGVLRIA